MIISYLAKELGKYGFSMTARTAAGVARELAQSDAALVAYSVDSGNLIEVSVLPDPNVLSLYESQIAFHIRRGLCSSLPGGPPVFDTISGADVLFVPVFSEGKVVAILGVIGGQKLGDKDTRLALQRVATMISGADCPEPVRETYESPYPVAFRPFSDFVYLCARCRKVRRRGGPWCDLEVFIEEHTASKVSHGLCADCAKYYLEDLTV